MAQINLPEAKKVLAFNPARILIGVFRSGRAAAEVAKHTAQAISNTCTGKAITAAGFYWRHERSDVPLTIADIGVLTLEEYDALCDIDRKYLPSQKIKNKRVLPLKNK